MFVTHIRKMHVTVFRKTSINVCNMEYKLITRVYIFPQHVIYSWKVYHIGSKES